MKKMFNYRNIFVTPLMILSFIASAQDSQLTTHDSPLTWTEAAPGVWKG
jgi:hypothetical protein